MKEVTTPLNEDGNDDYCEYFRSRKEMDTEKYSVTNAQWNSIGTFRNSPTDLLIARTLLFIARTVPNLVMGRKNLE